MRENIAKIFREDRTISDDKWKNIQEDYGEIFKKHSKDNADLHKELIKQLGNLNRQVKETSEKVACQLSARVITISQAMFELQKLIEKSYNKIKLMTSLMRRIDRVLDIVRHIGDLNKQNYDSLESFRYADERADDIVIRALKEEEELAIDSNDALCSIKNQIKVATDQLKNLKEKMELIWSDKHEANQRNVSAANYLVTDHKNLFFPESANYSAEHKMPTIDKELKILEDVEQLMSDLEEMRAIARAIMVNLGHRHTNMNKKVVEAMQSRYNEIEVHKHRQENQLASKILEIEQVERNKRKVQKEYELKRDYLKLAQSRMHERNRRPIPEMIYDAPYYTNEKEIYELCSQIEHMQRTLQDLEEVYNMLMNDRKILQKEIQMKQRTIDILLQQTAIRSTFPDIVYFQGFRDFIYIPTTERCKDVNELVNN
ncbi:hypothetical protein SNEBB_002779 [Seison nebaliae]|nr:hypothetical protein SNEBB_002779 [Seison nebaliae]